MKCLRFFLLLALALPGCEEKVRPSIVSLPDANVPSQESWRSTVTFSDSARIKAILWAGHIAVHASSQFTLLDDSIHVDFFDEAERHSSTLTALRGRVDDRTRDFDAHENVVVVSDSGVVLKTDSLFWNNAGRIIHTPAYVVITSKTEEIRGTGLVSDQSLKNYTFTKVSGRAVTRE
jgi:LPS export ABC transporter protein LptC